MFEWCDPGALGGQRGEGARGGVLEDRDANGRMPVARLLGFTNRLLDIAVGPLAGRPQERQDVPIIRRMLRGRAS
jgi:hypothetical protein